MGLLWRVRPTGGPHLLLLLLLAPACFKGTSPEFNLRCLYAYSPLPDPGAFVCLPGAPALGYMRRVPILGPWFI